MACSNCFNGCTEITSDKCVKYTGVDVPLLDIKNGDSLSYVEQTLIGFLASALDGTGIVITISPSDYCTLVTQYLNDCGDVTLVTLSKALVKAACDLQAQLTAYETSTNATLLTITNALTALNANYDLPVDVNCTLVGVTPSSDTHDILQAVIYKLCSIATNYVKLADLNSLIQSYLESQSVANKAYTKMVPYTVVEYYGPTSNYPAVGDFFDANGVGQGYWQKVYLCNGYNGLTPDKRGRVAVGAISGVPGPALNPAVDPAVDPTFNPNYTVGIPVGANSTTLTTSQIPSHTHAPTVTQYTHTHFTAKYNTGTSGNAGVPTASLPVASSVDSGITSAYIMNSSNLGTADVGLTSPNTSNVGVSIANAGGGQAHSNVQPVLPCYYIMYIP